jgi:hypothetical protein
MPSSIHNKRTARRKNAGRVKCRACGVLLDALSKCRTNTEAHRRYAAFIRHHNGVHHK